MKHIEDVVEQNDNNFDGIINNTTSMSELEEKVRQGKTILLTDMCKAIKNECEKPDIKPDKKPSIHDKLKQARALIVLMNWRLSLHVVKVKSL